MANASKFNIKGTEVNLVSSGSSGTIGYLPIVDLGTEYTSELKSDISSGTFEKAKVGGRLTINGHKYLLAHPNYWLHTGDTECTTNHMLVVPEDGFLGTAQMEASNITTNGYAGSAMRNSNLASAISTIETDFGASNILSHREYFTNKSANGYASAGSWYDSKVDLMNEIMVYGTQIFTNVSNGTNLPTSYTIDKTQILLFKFRPDLIVCFTTSGSRYHWWLRDVVSATNFALVNYFGGADRSNASDSYVIRPAFAIC